MSNRLYIYNNTFTNENDFSSNFSIADPSYVKTVDECQSLALQNISPFFALNDFCNNNMESICSLGHPDKTIAQSAPLINNATKCVDSNCYTTINGDNFGMGNNYSVYTSPRLTINMLLEEDSDNILGSTINDNIISEVIGAARKALGEFINHREAYLGSYFKYVSVNNNEIILSDEVRRKEEDMNESQTLLEAELKDLNDLFNRILKITSVFSEKISIFNEIIQILNSKIIIAEKFFNVLMSKNQGAIGEFDLTEYNRNLSIFENVVLTIIMSTVLYLYFKK